VFTVSAVDYQKKLNLRKGDGAAKVFTGDLKETEVPQLRSFLQSIVGKLGNSTERYCGEGRKAGAMLISASGDAIPSTAHVRPPSGYAQSSKAPSAKRSSKVSRKEKLSAQEFRIAPSRNSKTQVADAVPGEPVARIEEPGAERNALATSASNGKDPEAPVPSSGSTADLSVVPLAAVEEPDHLLSFNKESASKRKKDNAPGNSTVDGSSMAASFLASILGAI